MSKIPTTPEDDPRLPILTDEQKAWLRANFDKMPINALTKGAFPDRPDIDGRSFEGKAVKYYLASLDKVATTSKKVPLGDLALTDDQKLFIDENGKGGKMTPLEMKMVLFPEDTKNTLLSREGRAVFAYFKLVHDEEVNQFDEPVDTQRYRPPVSLPEVRNIVNGHVTNQVEPLKPAYSYGELRPFETKCLKALQGYLKTLRFVLQATQYDKKHDRTLFESTFVRAVHDKPDLQASDIDLYVLGAAEMVNITREERKILKLEDKLHSILDSQNEQGGEKQHLSQSFVELVNQTRTKWDASKKRYQDIMGDLESTRAARNEHKIQQNQSVINLMEAWQKDEETRLDIIAFGEKEKAEDVAEMKRLSEFDQVIALIAGMTVKEGSS